MTTYRAGQRVRIEWPGGSAIEGVVEFRYGDPSVPVGDIAPTWWTVDFDDGRTVTVLSEPRPDEPTGLGAVVEDVHGGLWIRADKGEAECWREVLPGTYNEDDACRRIWESVPAVRVLSEGWTP